MKKLGYFEIFIPHPLNHRIFQNGDGFCSDMEKSLSDFSLLSFGFDSELILSHSYVGHIFSDMIFFLRTILSQTESCGFKTFDQFDL